MRRWANARLALIGKYPRTILLSVLLVVAGDGWSQTAPTLAWRGVLQDKTAQHISQATVKLDAGNEHKEAATDQDGVFLFSSMLPRTYHVSVVINGRVYRSSADIKISAQAAVTLTLQGDGGLSVGVQQEKAAAGGEQLTSKAVSEIPLNKRDFSQLLLLAAGTAADSSGAYNFTQQFAINGQRGVEATFALDGADSSDPELGGGTFTNFNVDAVLELQSLSGVMPAEIGRGPRASQTSSPGPARTHFTVRCLSSCETPPWTRVTTSTSPHQQILGASRHSSETSSALRTVGRFSSHTSTTVAVRHITSGSIKASVKSLARRRSCQCLRRSSEQE
ncbi:carboxypeptidase-like regulatory domain-containing protein [Tunturiibacter gelidiferens]|uniref:carboxypeptidase-like regulatory domain-containing protein n=1 Tax=Tunturiibacter gelidiferens TaxID=3069689 RepID=UPI003D9B1D78